MNKDELHYSNDEITVIWKPKVCIHSGNCVNGLGKVFNPKAKPWININAASSEEIIKTVNNCPSGALTFKRNDEMAKTNNELQQEFKVKVSKGGPYIIKGKITIVDRDGKEILKEGSVALCRCGNSSNKPFCDGNHNKIKFDTD